MIKCGTTESLVLTKFFHFWCLTFRDQFWRQGKVISMCWYHLAMFGRSLLLLKTQLPWSKLFYSTILIVKVIFSSWRWLSHGRILKILFIFITKYPKLLVFSIFFTNISLYFSLALRKRGAGMQFSTFSMMDCSFDSSRCQKSTRSATPIFPSVMVKSKNRNRLSLKIFNTHICKSPLMREILFPWKIFLWEGPNFPVSKRGKIRKGAYTKRPSIEFGVFLRWLKCY